MKVVTITLNPAIDQTVRVDHLRTNSVNRGQAMQFDAGGKGVNVASYLADYRLQMPAPRVDAASIVEVVVTGFLGQENTALFESLFSKKQITDHFVRIPGQTRTNVKISDEANQETTDINMPGQSPPPASIRALYEKVDALLPTTDWFVLAGNLPPQVPLSIYATLIAQIKAYGKHVALDSSREALREGVLARPDIIKPNIHELEQLVGRELVGETAVIQAAHQLLNEGIKLVVVSMGEQGALFIDQQQTLKAIPPTVPVKSTVGAGDAMVAGLVAGQIQGLSLADCARLATAFSLGGITRVGAHLPDSATLQSFVNQVSVQALEPTIP